jgi:hypothetical protein
MPMTWDTLYGEMKPMRLSLYDISGLRRRRDRVGA